MIRALHPYKPKLVVIGNGMAGARLVDDILACDPDIFDVTMFGDEPYGNYNRILLSNVLNGTQEAKEIFLNPLSWYQENNIRFHAGKRVSSVDRAAKTVHAGDLVEAYDHLVIATGSRPFVPPLLGGGQAGRVRVSHVGRLPQHRRLCQGQKESRRHRRRSARLGGGQGLADAQP